MAGWLEAAVRFSMFWWAGWVVGPKGMKLALHAADGNGECGDAAAECMAAAECVARQAAWLEATDMAVLGIG